jgi:NADH:ubiquinone oxidoreductase subunit D
LLMQPWFTIWFLRFVGFCSFFLVKIVLRQSILGIRGEVTGIRETKQYFRCLTKALGE